MSKPGTGRRWVWTMISVVAVCGILGFALTRLVPVVAQQAARDTASFGEEAVLAWHDDGATDAKVNLGTGGARFLSKVFNAGGETVYGWGNGVTNVFSGDFNADGKWDVGVTGSAADGDRCWYVRYGDGKGSFGKETKYCWGNGATNVFTGDFNGDGKWDVGVTGTRDQQERCWYIRYGDGKGSFGNETYYCWGNGVANAFAGDFNGDGKWDIGVTGTADDQDRCWYIRYGDGKGSFGNETKYCWNNGVTNVFTGDFNGDGKWDIGVTGTAKQGDRTWYIRFGDGKGSFSDQAEYTWGNGVTNVFTGDFNGDKLWDLGVTGDRLTRDGNWYIRYNKGGAGSFAGNSAPSQPAGPDPKAKLAADMADTAYSKLLGRWPSQQEKDYWAGRLKQGLSTEDMWGEIARSQERVDKRGFWAPSRTDFNGKRERCFGAIGPKCDGTPVTPAAQWVNKFTRPDGVEMGWLKVPTAVGSIDHDNACLRDTTGVGAWCGGLPTVPLAEWPLTKALVPAAREWNKAVYNVRDGRWWFDFYGPYPTDSSLQEQYSDDLTQVPNRPSKMAKVSPIGAMPVTTDAFTLGETRQSHSLWAPATAVMDRGDESFCASGKWKEDGQWWTAQWWSICQ